MSDIARVQVFYSGYVQGVGFRFTTQMMSKGFEVVGFVKNLPDGRVQMEAEGERSEVERFLDALYKRWEGQLSGVKTDWVSAIHSEPSFEIQL